MQNFFFPLIAISNACEKRNTPVVRGKRVSRMINSELMEAIGSSNIKMRHLAWLLTSKIESHNQESPHPHNRKDSIDFLNVLAEESFYDGLSRPDTKWKIVQILPSMPTI